MSDFINTIDALGDDVVMDSIIDRTITEFKDDTLSTIGEHAFYGCTALTTVNIPNVTSVNAYAFRGCTSLTTADMPNTTSIGAYAFQGCTALETIDFPNVTQLPNHTFSGCSALKNVNFSKFTALGNYAFDYCSSIVEATFAKLVTFNDGICRQWRSVEKIDCHVAEKMILYEGNQKLKALIIRTPTVCSLPSTYFPTSNAIVAGTGYVYVPRALIEDYKVATNWSTCAAQFRALEDYTVDGTVTGELDESKI